MQRISGRIVDVVNRTDYPGTIEVAGGVIRRITRDARARGPHLLMPGLVDAHIHIESSLLPPAEFARHAVVHGTVATVSDPHEIANVLGAAGVRYMIADGRRTPFSSTSAHRRACRRRPLRPPARRSTPARWAGCWRDATCVSLPR